MSPFSMELKKSYFYSKFNELILTPPFLTVRVYIRWISQDLWKLKSQDGVHFSSTQIPIGHLPVENVQTYVGQSTERIEASIEWVLDSRIARSRPWWSADGLVARSVEKYRDSSLDRHSRGRSPSPGEIRGGEAPDPGSFEGIVTRASIKLLKVRYWKKRIDSVIVENQKKCVEKAEWNEESVHN